eukprot:319102-Chlamydomonas_euryale.AAC.1
MPGTRAPIPACFSMPDGGHPCPALAHPSLHASACQMGDIHAPHSRTHPCMLQHARWGTCMPRIRAPSDACFSIADMAHACCTALQLLQQLQQAVQAPLQGSDTWCTRTVIQDN